MLVRRALKLLGRHLGPLAFLVLMIWLPGNLLVEYLAYEVYDPDDIVESMRASMGIELIFGSFYTSATLAYLFAAERTEEPSISRALRSALAIWPRVFWARFASGILVLAGLIVFVLPGLVLAVRLVAIDAVVVREYHGPWDAIKRSWEVTRGRGWRLCGGLAMVFLLWGLAAIFMGLTQSVVPGLDTWLSSALLSCPPDVVSQLFTIVVFLHYCAATREPSAAGATPSPDRCCI